MTCSFTDFKEEDSTFFQIYIRKATPPIPIPLYGKTWSIIQHRYFIFDRKFCSKKNLLCWTCEIYPGILCGILCCDVAMEFEFPLLSITTFHCSMLHAVTAATCSLFFCWNVNLPFSFLCKYNLRQDIWY